MHDATSAQTNTASTAREPALPLRGDTFLGVCEALGQDLSIPADLFRIAFAGLFFWNMGLAVALYLGLGAVIALARWVYPVRSSIVDASREVVENAAGQQLALAA